MAGESGGGLSRRGLVIGTAASAALAAVRLRPRTSVADERPTGYLYTSTNAVEAGENAVLGYAEDADGRLSPLPQGFVPTQGTGLNNGYIPGLNVGNSKAGPHDGDLPMAGTPNGKFLYVVNAGSDTVAAFAVGADGVLTPVAGSPFGSRGICPVSVAVSADGSRLAVANRNEDPARQYLLRSGTGNVAIFDIGADGALTPVGETLAIAPVTSGTGSQTLPSQVYWSPVVPDLLFVNNFRLDVGGSDASRPDYANRWAAEPQFNGNVQWVKVSTDGSSVGGHLDLPDVPAAGADVPPSVPLNIWGHPGERVLYVNLVTRDALGVLDYDDEGTLTWVTSVPSSGRAVCWLRANAEGTRLYQVSGAPNADLHDSGSSIEVFDISGDRARSPVEIQRVPVPTYGAHPFTGQDGNPVTGTAFIPAVSADGRSFYLGMQRSDQTAENRDPEGNYLLRYLVRPDGTLSEGPVLARDLLLDDFPPSGRAWGLVPIGR